MKAKKRDTICHQFKGLIIDFDDYQPLSNISHTVYAKVTHKNPMLRHKAESIYSQIYIAMRDKKLMWRWECSAEFEDKKGVQIESFSFSEFLSLTEMKDISEALLDQTVNKIGEDKILKTNTKVECLGLHRTNCDTNLIHDLIAVLDIAR